ncbi:C2H2-type zinc finger protein [Streptomyces sp. NPDC052042]|uniref:C2H2-type zinc finger protein n=1 Tax=Streptomyces sp. NPDC052042 TaxID=3365683 RepID=UPI0037CDE999
MSKRVSRTNATQPADLRRLTRSDLAAFDQEARDLILESMAIGYLGRVSSKGHCILRNNTGGSAAVPRSMTSSNRSAQNTRADVRRLMAEHRRTGQPEASSRAPRVPHSPRRITVAQAFVEYGAAFSRWFDELASGLSADQLLDAVIGPDDQPTFDIVETETETGTGTGTKSESEVEAETKSATAVAAVTVSIPAQAPAGATPGPAEAVPDPAEHVCPVCGRTCRSPAALGSHLRVHRTNRPTTRPGPGQKAEPDVPAATQPTKTPVVDSPEEVLRRIRAALGEDPQITLLQGRVAELEAQLAKESRRADEAQARLALVQEAMNA